MLSRGAGLRLLALFEAGENSSTPTDVWRWFRRQGTRYEYGLEGWVFRASRPGSCDGQGVVFSTRTGLVRGSRSSYNSRGQHQGLEVNTAAPGSQWSSVSRGGGAWTCFGRRRPDAPPRSGPLKRLHHKHELPLGG